MLILLSGLLILKLGESEILDSLYMYVIRAVSNVLKMDV